MQQNEIKQDFPQDFRDIPAGGIIQYIFGSRLGDLKNFRIPISKLIESIGVISSGGTPVYFEGDQLPSKNNLDQDLQRGDWSILPNDITYNNINDGPDIIPIESHLNFIQFNGSTWSLIDMGALPVEPKTQVIERDNELAPTSDATYKEIYNKSMIKGEIMDNVDVHFPDDDSNGYVGVSTGLINPSDDANKVSKIIDLSENIESITVMDRLGNGGFVFYNSSNEPMKPINDNGTEMVQYSTPLNGTFKKPTGAVSFRITTKFGGNGGNPTIILNKGEIVTDEKINKGFIPRTDDVQELLDKSVGYDYILNTEVIDRKNAGENTSTPQYLSARVETTTGPKIELVENDFPYLSDRFPYMRAISNATVVNGNANYVQYNIDVSERPSNINVSYWVKESQFDAIWPTALTVYFSNKAFNINTVSLKSAPIGTYINAVPALPDMPTQYSAVNVSMAIIARDGDWIRLSVNNSGIVWNTDFTGSSMPHFFFLTGGLMNGKTLNLVDYTILFGTVAIDKVIYPKSSDGIQPYPLTVPSMSKSVTELQGQVKEIAMQGGVVGLKKEGQYVYVSTRFNDTQDLIKTIDFNRPNSNANNPNLNFIDAKLGNGFLGGEVIKAENDDITPVVISNSFIGANHGWSLTRKITKTAHGKTFSDIGSKYKNASNIEFVITTIIDANNFGISSFNQASDGTYQFIAPSGDLTHVSGGVNTATITGYTESKLDNLWPGITVSERTIMDAGGKVITDDGEYYSDRFTILETYSILDLASVIERLVSQRPSGGYTSNVLFNTLGADTLAKQSIAYEFQSGGATVVKHPYLSIKNHDFWRHGFIQASNMGGELYIPDTISFSVSGTTYNFQKGQNMSVAIGSEINFTSSRWANASKPPLRAVFKNGNRVLGLGYLPDLGSMSGLPVADSPIPMRISTAKKVYPQIISRQHMMPNGDRYEVVAYRVYAEVLSGNIYSKYHVENNNSIYLYVDLKNTGVESIKPETKWTGKKITVLDTVGDIQVLNSIVTGSIDIRHNIATGSIGYMVLKLS